MTTDSKILAFYWAPRDLTVPRTGEPIKVGETVSVDCVPYLCNRGLHASRMPSYAASYREDGIPTLVEVWGDVKEGSDKLCGRHRKTLAIADAAMMAEIDAALAKLMKESDAAEKECHDVVDPAWKKYEEIRKKTWAEYSEIRDTAQYARDASLEAALNDYEYDGDSEEYYRRCGEIREQYESFVNPVRKRMDDIRETAWRDYIAVRDAAFDKHGDVASGVRFEFDSLVRKVFGV